MFSSSPVAFWKRSPNSSCQVVRMCSTSTSSVMSWTSPALGIARPSRMTTFVFTGSLCPAKRSASRANGSDTPASSNITRPGLTTATHPSGFPLPEPMRVSAGFWVTGLSG